MPSAALGLVILVLVLYAAVSVLVLRILSCLRHGSALINATAASIEYTFSYFVTFLRIRIVRCDFDCAEQGR